MSTSLFRKLIVSILLLPAGILFLVLGGPPTLLLVLLDTVGIFDGLPPLLVFIMFCSLEVVWLALLIFCLSFGEML